MPRDVTGRLGVDAATYQKLYNSFKSMARTGEVCAEWSTHFDRIYNFARWALDHGWKPGCRVVRDDRSRRWGPGNCRVVEFPDGWKGRTPKCS